MPLWLSVVSVLFFLSLLFFSLLFFPSCLYLCPIDYGFRYVQVLNFPGTPDEGTFTAHFIHSNVPQTGAFNSNNNLLNKIQHCTRFASLSNLMDVPTDCPQRERRGWMGDAQLSCETTISNFDMAAFYTKWLRDMRDSQLLLNHGGQLPDCVPYYGHGALPGDPAWTAAYGRGRRRTERKKEEKKKKKREGERERIEERKRKRT